MEHAGEVLGTVQQCVHRVHHVRQQLLLRLGYALEDLEDRLAVIASLLDRARLAPELAARGGRELGRLRTCGETETDIGRVGCGRPVQHLAPGVSGMPVPELAMIVIERGLAANTP